MSTTITIGLRAREDMNYVLPRDLMTDEIIDRFEATYLETARRLEELAGIDIRVDVDAFDGEYESEDALGVWQAIHDAINLDLDTGESTVNESALAFQAEIIQSVMGVESPEQQS